MRLSEMVERNGATWLDNPLHRNLILPPLTADSWASDHFKNSKFWINKPPPNAAGLVMVDHSASDHQTRSLEPLLRVTQLEHNIRFLQAEHQLMLDGLHKEIDNLRRQNRELQFQLVFSKANVNTPNSPSSSEEDAAKCKIFTSPKQVNATPLQVELLEKEIGELKVSLKDVNARNAYLSNIIEEQKKKFDRLERDRQSLQPDPDLLKKLDEAEETIRKLRKENEDLTRARGQGRYWHSRGGHPRFPPLHQHHHHHQQPQPPQPQPQPQGYWGRSGGPGGAAPRPVGERNAPQSLALPLLQPELHQPPFQRNGKGPTNNNHHHHRGRARQQSQNQQQHQQHHHHNHHHNHQQQQQPPKEP